MPSICSFFGHSFVKDEIRTGLYTEIERHITNKNIDTFYVGGYGNFDSMVSSVLHDIKKRYSNISVFRILAYMPTEVSKGNYEFPTLYPEGLELVPKKFAISKCNRWIVNQTDYIIAYVSLNYGGAFEALKYAKCKNKSIVNLAEREVK